MSHSARYSSEQQRKRRTVINQERKSDSSLSGAIKIVTLKQPTKDSSVALKTGYRQADKQTNRQTDRQKLYLPSDRPYPFSLGNCPLRLSDADDLKRALQPCPRFLGCLRNRWEIPSLKRFTPEHTLSNLLSRPRKLLRTIWPTCISTRG